MEKKFAFIVHLRSLDDIAYVIPFMPKFIITRIFRRPILWLFRKLRGRWGFAVRSRFSVNEEMEGYIILIWLTGSQMMSGQGFVRERILEVVLYAQDELECEVIGLGALTASVTKAGNWLIDQPGIKPETVITHGDSYAVSLTLEGVSEIARKFDGLSRSTVAIVGATGIIGEALSRALSGKARELILIARKREKLERLQNSLLGRASIDTQIQAVKEADIVITATSWPESLINSEDLKEGAVVYEVSQPRNVPKKVLYERPDVLVIDGAYAQVPPDVKFWWMSLPRHSTFGCMAETMITALANGSIERKHRVGQIDLEFVEKMRELGKKYGFGHAEFTSFNKEIVSR